MFAYVVTPSDIKVSCVRCSEGTFSQKIKKVEDRGDIFHDKEYTEQKLDQFLSCRLERGRTT
jgi:hypothetical protein